MHKKTTTKKTSKCGFWLAVTLILTEGLFRGDFIRYCGKHKLAATIMRIILATSIATASRMQVL